MMKLIFSLLAWIAVLVGAYWLFVMGGFQYLQDQYFLATYKPAPQIAALAAEDTMHGKGLTYFYESDPQIVDSATIQQHCPGGSGIEVFGCYAGGKIYVLDIQNPQLRSEMGTAAAHEMLHAAYAHMSKKEQGAINAEVANAVAMCEANTPAMNLATRLQDYQQSEPGEEDNELHSILGTECTNVGSTLEQYYTRYFNSRSTLVALSTQYNNVFASAQRGLENDKASYIVCSNTLDALQKQIDAMESQMNADRSSGNISGYNSLVGQHNQLVDEYNSDRDHCISLQNQYNDAVDSYNQLIMSQ